MAERLNITELDFDNIKQNLKTYLIANKKNLQTTTSKVQVWICIVRLTILQYTLQCFVFEHVGKRNVFRFC